MKIKHLFIALTICVPQLLLANGNPVELWYNHPASNWNEALPSAWKDGEVKGLRARGGYTVDIRWKDGQLAEATINADKAGKCKVRFGDRVKTVKITPEKPWKF